MATYKFEQWDIQIIEPEIKWTFAGFSREGDGLMQVHVQLKTESTTFLVPLEKIGQADDKSDEAIDLLMHHLLSEFIVEE